MGVRYFRTLEIARMMAVAGYDFLFIDCEHSAFGLETAADLCRASLDAGITPVVRVCSVDYHLSNRLLDHGAQGIVYPRITRRQEVEEALQNTKYPPRGRRGMISRMVYSDYQPADPGEVTAWLDEETLIVIQLESQEAVDRVDELISVEGVDVAMIGTSDLTQALGIPGQRNHPRVVACYERVFEACAKHGVIPGMGGVYVLEDMLKWIKRGMRFILCGSEVDFLMQGATQWAKNIREGISSA